MLIDILKRMQGTIIYPYRNETLIDKFSNIDTDSAHINLVTENLDAFNESSKGKTAGNTSLRIS